VKVADKKDNRLADSQKRNAEINKDQLARAEGAQPTPTQEENDRAKLGVSDLSELDNKVSDGSDKQESPANPPKR
jgi:hypothetical protein